MEPGGIQKATRLWILVPIIFGLTLAILLLVFLLKASQAAPRFTASAPDCATTSFRTIRTQQTSSSVSLNTVTSPSPSPSTRRKTTLRGARSSAGAVTQTGTAATTARRTAASTVRSTADNLAAYEAELAHINAVYAVAEQTYRDTLSDLAIQREIDLEILKEQYAAIQQLDSGAYRLARKTLITRYKKLEDDSFALLVVSQKERDAALERLKQTYKIPE